MFMLCLYVYDVFKFIIQHLQCDEKRTYGITITTNALKYWLGGWLCTYTMRLMAKAGRRLEGK